MSFEKRLSMPISLRKTPLLRGENAKHFLRKEKERLHKLEKRTNQIIERIRWSCGD